MNIIRQAMENLPGHWHQGAITDGRGNRCGIGHIFNAYAEVSGNGVLSPEQLSEIKFLHEKAEEMYPDRIIGLSTPFASFNDHEDTTEEEVLAVMEKAAIALDEQI